MYRNLLSAIYEDKRVMVIYFKMLFCYFRLDLVWLFTVLYSDSYVKTIQTEVHLLQLELKQSSFVSP